MSSYCCIDHAPELQTCNKFFLFTCHFSSPRNFARGSLLVLTISTAAFIEHIISVPRRFKSCFDLHPIIVGVLIHRFVPVILLYTNHRYFTVNFLCLYRNTVKGNVKFVTFLNGRWESRTPKGFNTSTLFKSGSVANRIDLPN